MAGSFLEQSAQGYARIKKRVAVLAGKLRGDPVPLSPGLYASQRAEGERVPRFRHQFLHGEFSAETRKFLDRFIAAMDDDLNTPNAVAALFDYVSDLYVRDLERVSDIGSLSAHRGGGRAGRHRGRSKWQVMSRSGR